MFVHFNEYYHSINPLSEDAFWEQPNSRNGIPRNIFLVVNTCKAFIFKI